MHYFESVIVPIRVLQNIDRKVLQPFERSDSSDEALNFDKIAPMHVDCDIRYRVPRPDGQAAMQIQEAP